MSIGIGAIAKLVLQDDVTIIYEYGGFNWNESEYRNSELEENRRKEYRCDGLTSAV